MNILWTAVITVVLSLERVVGWGDRLVRATGIVAGTTGIAFIAVPVVQCGSVARTTPTSSAFATTEVAIARRRGNRKSGAAPGESAEIGSAVAPDSDAPPRASGTP